MIFGLDDHLIVGLADDPDGSLRVYIDHRSTNRHTHIDAAAKAEMQQAWAGSFMGHLVSQIPAHALCDCPEPVRRLGGAG